MRFSVLLVDDTPDDRVLVARELRRHFPGVEVLEAGSPDTLAQALDAGRFDLTITDYRLRFSDGITVLRELKARFPERPVIMFTASGNEEVAVEAMKEGLDDYITKTAKHYPRIGYAVRSCLDQVKGRAQLRQALAGESLAKARLEIALQSAGMGTWQVDLGDGRVACSDAVGPLLGQASGYCPESIARWLDYIHPDDRAQVAARRDGALGGADHYQGQYRAIGADGVTRWIASSGRVLRDDAGRPAHLIGTVREITAEITTRHNLERKTEQLERADRQKNEFLSILAHELRNPLAAAGYSIALLRHAGNDPTVVGRATDVIDRQISHMARLLDELLDLSRIVHGRIALERQPLDMRRIVELGLESVRSALDGKGHQLTLNLPPGPVEVVGDEVRLTQVMANLLGNAVKFTPAHGRIEVRAGTQARQAVVEVIDNGIGIDPARLEEVFEMFSQAETKAHGGTPGLGIGLATARSLVELHDGTVLAESAGLGQGVRIRVALPLAPSSAPAAPPDAGAALPGGDAGLRVLLADDNVDAVQLLAEVLRIEGQTVYTAFNGQAAIELAATVQPDVMVLDIGMPGASGHEVAQWVRQQPWGARVALIAVTGWGQEHDGERASDAGFDLRLVKPVAIDQLIGAIRRRPT